MIYLGKDVENRSNWRFAYRGPIVIHASATPPSSEDWKRFLELAAADGASEEELALVNPASPAFAPEIFAQGAIIGIAELADVFGPTDETPEEHPAYDSPWANDDANYWLYFSEMTPVEPVPYRGRVGMFRVEYDVIASLIERPDSPEE